MLKFFSLLTLLLSVLFGQTYLESAYVTESKEIKLSDIDKNIQHDITLYTINRTRHTKRVKTKELLRLLEENGVKDYIQRYPYVTFMQKSPIDTKRIEKFVTNYYTKHYPTIEIKKLLLSPRSFTSTLPKEYTLHMQNKSFLRKKAILILKSNRGRDTFFNIHITATIEVISARKKIQRSQELSPLNTIKKKVFLEKFYAPPLTHIKKSSLQAMHVIKKDSIISSRDVRPLFLVHRGSNVNVSLDNSTLCISFMAKAIQNGCYGDIIQVVNHKGKKIKVMITGKRQAEVR